MLPCGNAVKVPKLTDALPGAPSARCAAAMFARKSSCVMPSRKVWNAARKASMVMSLAFCINASSVARLAHAAAGGDRFAIDEIRAQALPSSRR